MGSDLIDSNIVIDYLNRKLPVKGIQLLNQRIKKGAALSVISKIELLSQPMPSSDEALMRQFIATVQVLPITEEVVDRAIAIRKLTRIKIPDAIIASTASLNRSLLITRNVQDFKGIPELELFNPWTLY